MASSVGVRESSKALVVGVVIQDEPSGDRVSQWPAE